MDLTLSNPKFLNWIKAALAVLYTKEEIVPVVSAEIVEFQQTCLQNIYISNGLPTGSKCSTCRTENVIKCPTDKICNFQGKKCNFHRKHATTPCKNKICNSLKTEIDNAHRHKCPTYKNTDATKWCNNPWEIAKCFMSPDGYRDVTTAEETDFNGIINVIINHKGFDAKISDDLSNKDNIFLKGKDVGRAIRHSPKFELEDTDLTKYCTILNNMLSDRGFVAMKNMKKLPHSASHKLAKLQRDEITVLNGDIRKVLHDIGKEIQERSERDEVEKRILDLIKTVEDTEDRVKVSVTKLIDELEAKMQEFKVEQETHRYKDKKGQQNQENESIWQWIYMRITWAFQWIIYREKKREFRNKLIEFYKSEYSTLALTQTDEEIDTPLAGLYVMPDLILVKQKHLSSDEEETTEVKSLRDIFTMENEWQKEIYLSADAGFGKTAFSKCLANVWCEAFYPDKNSKSCFTGEELGALSNFEFVFLVLLRDSTAISSIDGMIENQLIKKLPPPKSQYPLQEILSREKCLIIIDGLDEWTHPDSSCSDQREKIPHRCAHDKCVILTTTRPWKLGISNLKKSDINKKVDLVQLSKDSTKRLEKNAISRMCDVNEDGELEKKMQDFNKAIAERGLEHMLSIPLFQLHMLCLWCDDKPIGDSLLDVYTNIIELLLTRMAQKHPKVHPSFEVSDDDIPGFFKNHKFCKKFYSLLMALSKLAFKTFFHENRENTLLFDSTVVVESLNECDRKLSYLSGILTERTSATLTERTSKVSFLNNVVQRFFLAIFIGSHSDSHKTVIEKCINVQSILDLSIVYEYLSKRNSKMLHAILTGLMSVINKDEETLQYRTRTVMNISSEPLYKLQKLLLSCLKEIPESDRITLCLQDFCINDSTINDEQLIRLSEHEKNKKNMKSLYINTCNISLCLSEIVRKFSLTDLDNLQKLHYCNDSKEADISLLFFPNLRTIILSSAILRNYDGNFSKKIGYLHFLNLTMSHEILEIIFNFIRDQRDMEELTLDGLICKEHDCLKCKRPLKFDLSKHSKLKQIKLKNLPSLRLNLATPTLDCVQLLFINLGESSFLRSRDILNIERLELENIEISAESFIEYMNALEDLPHSVTLKVVSCDIEPETEYERVRDYIKGTQTFV